MKAVGYQKSYPADHPQALVDLELPDPVATGRDVLVEVRAVSVNPVDTKVRRGMAPAEGEWRVLGWDAAGIVRAVGPEVSLFKAGDRVWYAGSIARPGSNSELHLVDERIASKMPESLDFPQAAALPLTSLTAWEMLFDRLEIQPGENGKSILIIGAAGGVGSIMVQLARQLTGLTIIGTASREETQNWVKEMGAHHVINHNESLTEQLAQLHIQPDYVVSLTQTEKHIQQIVEMIKPQGKFGLIDDPESFDIKLLKRKSLSLHWELMFTRALFTTEDISQQNAILSEVAQMVDSKKLRTTFTESFGTINADNLKRAHALIESGKARGKIVLAGF
ncbi:MAG: zinc-binding alcohol dehydrogenase family protein [Cellvibrionaceae bacterium]|nr:zinc-binding alcohol dehydrogenase family protein [Cellvibrionaceae bacterium]